MTNRDEMQLLQDYACGSEEAFAVLVARHLNLVHSVALRHVRDSHQAEEIAQAVFVILSRKAGKLPERTILSGWLYHTARLTAANFVRSEMRRLHREQEAYQESLMRENQTTDAWKQMAPVLDEAMASLSQSDRDAIVLRFMEGRDFKEAGAAMGASEDGMRMKVRRALDKLRKFLARRGVSLSAAVIAGALSAHAVQAAPPALLGSVVVAAAKGTSLSASTSTLIQGTLKLMAWAKIKMAALTGACLLVAAGTATVAVKTVYGTELQSAVAAFPDTNAAEKVLDTIINNHRVDSRTVPHDVALVLVRPTKAVGMELGGHGDNGTVAVGASLADVIAYAYNRQPPAFPNARILIPPELAATHYDFIDNIATNGGREILQRQLKERFGIMTVPVMRQVDVLTLTVKNTNADGLQRTQDVAGGGDGAAGANVVGGRGGGGAGFGGGGGTTVALPDGGAAGFSRGGRGASFGGRMILGKDMDSAALASQISDKLGVPVVDHTGLTGGYDVKLTWPRNATSLDDLKAAVLDQLGLELTPTTEKRSVEFLQVTKPGAM